jgi:hypothetical protein
MWEKFKNIKGSTVLAVLFFLELIATIIEGVVYKLVANTEINIRLADQVPTSEALPILIIGYFIVRAIEKKV